MKKFLTLALTAVMALSLLTACGSKNDNSADTNTDGSNTETTLSGTVSTDGSTSMEKVINSLGESFMAMNKDVKFTYNPTGSGSGIQAVSEGRCDIGLSSRALKDDEKASGLVETVVALDGIAIVVNPENPVSDLDIDTIAKIYTGEITNWKDVGGEDAEIVRIGREAGSGTRDGFESITDTKDKCQYRQELTSTGDVITAVSQNPDAIGYASLASIKDTVKALNVDGVTPSEATVKDGSYVLSRPFNIVTNGDATDPVAVDFIAYVLSKDGQAIATDNGYIGEDGADFTSAQPEGKIVVGGSSSVSPLMEKLIEAYKTVNPNAELELQTTDSTTGVSGALEGTYTIGMASRELKDSEVEGGAKATVMALDGIAVVVNPGNTTDDLTVDQIKGIYTGELTTWSDVQ